jgi:hypothetical protein
MRVNRREFKVVRKEPIEAFDWEICLIRPVFDNLNDVNLRN